MKTVNSLWKTKDNPNTKNYIENKHQHCIEVEAIKHTKMTSAHEVHDKTKHTLEVNRNFNISIFAPQEPDKDFVPVAPPRKKRKNKMRKAPLPPKQNTVVSPNPQESAGETNVNLNKKRSNDVENESLSEVDDDFSEIETVLKKEMLQANNKGKSQEDIVGKENKVQELECLYATVQKKSKLKEQPDPNTVLQADLNSLYAVVQKKQMTLGNVQVQMSFENSSQGENKEPLQSQVVGRISRLDNNLENTQKALKHCSKDATDTSTTDSDKTIENEFNVQEENEDLYDVLSDTRNSRTPHRKAPTVQPAAKTQHHENNTNSISFQAKNKKDDEGIYENVPSPEKEAKASKKVVTGYGSSFILHAKAIKAELESKWKTNEVVYENISYDDVQTNKEDQASDLDSRMDKGSSNENVGNYSEANYSADQAQTLFSNSEQDQPNSRIRLNSEGKSAPPKPLRKSMERLNFAENSQASLEETETLITLVQPTAKPRLKINCEPDLNPDIENTTKIRPTAKPRVKLASDQTNSISSTEDALSTIVQENKLSNYIEFKNNQYVASNASLGTDLKASQHCSSESKQNICNFEDPNNQEAIKQVNIIEGQNLSHELLVKLSDISKEVNIIYGQINFDNLTEEKLLQHYDSLLKLSAKADAIKGKGDVQVRAEKKALLRKIQELADILDNKLVSSKC